ncbi:hypothetical protein LSM04_009012 [Trypanosoma melophagium]|uniref:uncharacterized protein n=1 Tax=Trypanosoma melophagium TaxID=715481 RepID=UPI00351A120F|nr:hypothetical protein LSM04_009012 [Trypanosoma melophagium]
MRESCIGSRSGSGGTVSSHMASPQLRNQEIQTSLLSFSSRSETNAMYTDNISNPSRIGPSSLAHRLSKKDSGVGTNLSLSPNGIESQPSVGALNRDYFVNGMSHLGHANDDNNSVVNGTPPSSSLSSSSLSSSSSSSSSSSMRSLSGSETGHSRYDESLKHIGKRVASNDSPVQVDIGLGSPYSSPGSVVHRFGKTSEKVSSPPSSSHDSYFILSPSSFYPSTTHASKKKERCKREKSVMVVDAEANVKPVKEKNSGMVSSSKSRIIVGYKPSLEETGETLTGGQNIAMILLYPMTSIDSFGKEVPSGMFSPIEEFFSSLLKWVKSSEVVNLGVFMQLSLSLVKHDQMKELLPMNVNDNDDNSVFYTKANVTFSPLFGPRITNANYREVSSLTDIRELVYGAFKKTTSDDRRYGTILLSLVLRQLRKEGDDIIISSFLGIMTTPETIHTIVKRRHPPLIASFFRSAFRNPRLTSTYIIPVTIKRVSLLEYEMQLVRDVEQVLRSNVMNPLSGNVSASLRTFIHLCMEDLRAKSADNKLGTLKKTTVDEENTLEISLAMTFNRLQMFSDDISLALKRPLTDFPCFSDSETGSTEKINGCKIKSEKISSRKGKRSKRKSKHKDMLLEKITSRWVRKKTTINMFAGILGAPIGGIRPLFTEFTQKNEKDSLAEETFDDHVYSLLLLERVENAKQREIVSIMNSKNVVVETVKGECNEFTLDEICVTRRDLNNTSANNDDVLDDKLTHHDGFPNSFLLNRALSLFANGYNTLILLTRDDGRNRGDVFASPTWRPLRKFVESQTQNHVAGCELYLSIVQVQSRECVRDHLAQRVHQRRDIPALPFRAAWTPAGPVARGATFVRIQSEKQFVEIIRELRKNSKVVGTSPYGGVSIILSFLLKRVLIEGSSSPHSTEASRHSDDVFLSSLTISLATRAEAYRSLWIEDFLPMEHGKNIYRCAHRHFTLAITDVSSCSLTATAMLDTQELLRRTNAPHPIERWSMRRMQQYLVERCTIYMQELVSRRGKSRLQLVEEKRSLILRKPEIATLRDVAEALSFAERMRSIITDLIDAPFLANPMAMVENETYDITAPPVCFHYQFNTSLSIPSNDNDRDNKLSFKLPIPERSSSGGGGGGSASYQVQIPFPPPRVQRQQDQEPDQRQQQQEQQQQSEQQQEQQQKRQQRQLENTVGNNSNSNNNNSAPAFHLTTSAAKNEMTFPNVGRFTGGIYPLSAGAPSVLTVPTMDKMDVSTTSINKQNRLMLRNDTVDVQKPYSKRLDDVVERVCVTFEKHIFADIKRDAPVQPLAAVILGAPSAKKTVVVTKKGIKVKSEEVGIAVVDKPSCAVASASDMPKVSGILTELIGRFLQGYNVTLLTAECSGARLSMTEPVLLDIVRMAFEQKKEKTFISFSLAFVSHGDVVHDLLSPPGKPSPSKLSVLRNPLFGATIRDGVVWHDVNTLPEINALTERAAANLSSLFVQYSNEDVQNAFVMLSVLARCVEPHDVVLSSFAAFSVRGAIHLYDPILPQKLGASKNGEGTSLIHLVTKERASIAKSLFVYHETMNENAAVRFLQVQKQLNGCLSVEPYRGSVAAMLKRYKGDTKNGKTMWKKIFRLPLLATDEKASIGPGSKPYLQYFDTVLSDTNKTILLDSENEGTVFLQLQPREVREIHCKEKFEKSPSTVDIIQAIYNACNHSSTMRTIVFLGTVQDKWKLREKSVVKILDSKKTFSLSEVVPLSAQGTLPSESVLSQELKKTVDRFIRGSACLVIFGGTTHSGAVSTTAIHTLVKNAFNATAPKRPGKPKSWISISCVLMIGDSTNEGIDLLCDTSKRVPNILLCTEVSEDCFHLRDTFRYKVKGLDGINSLFATISKRQNEQLALQKKEENYFVYNILLFDEQHDKIPIASICILDLRAAMLKWTRERETKVSFANESASNLVNKQCLNTVICVESHREDSSHELTTLMDFQKLLVKGSGLV